MFLEYISYIIGISAIVFYGYFTKCCLTSTYYNVLYYNKILNIQNLFWVVFMGLFVLDFTVILEFLVGDIFEFIHELFLICVFFFFSRIVNPLLFEFYNNKVSIPLIFLSAMYSLAIFVGSYLFGSSPLFFIDVVLNMFTNFFLGILLIHIKEHNIHEVPDPNLLAHVDELTSAFKVKPSDVVFNQHPTISDSFSILVPKDSVISMILDLYHNKMNQFEKDSFFARFSKAINDYTNTFDGDHSNVYHLSTDPNSFLLFHTYEIEEADIDRLSMKSASFSTQILKNITAVPVMDKSDISNYNEVSVREILDVMKIFDAAISQQSGILKEFFLMSPEEFNSIRDQFYGALDLLYLSPSGLYEKDENETETFAVYIDANTCIYDTLINYMVNANIDPDKMCPPSSIFKYENRYYQKLNLINFFQMLKDYFRTKYQDKILIQF